MIYRLMDCIEQNQKHPDTFQIDDADALDVGHYAKLVFQEADGKYGERMWVQVLSVTDEVYIGLLKNVPAFFPEETIKFDDVVVFNRRHVANVLPPEPGYVRMPRHH